MKSVARRISDRHVLHLVKMWLQMPVEETDERGHVHRTTLHKDSHRGTPQGAPISPLLSNLYMRRFVLGWKSLGHAERLKAYIVNYADDTCRQNRWTSWDTPSRVAGPLGRGVRISALARRRSGFAVCARRSMK